MDWVQAIITIATGAVGGIVVVIYNVIRNRNQDKISASSDIAIIKQGIEKLEEGQKDLGQRITKVADNLESFKVQAFETFVQKKDAPSLTATKSPPDLTDEGEKVAKQSKITQLIAKHQQRYFEELDQAQGDAELFSTCRRIALREFDENNEDIRFIKDYFYNAGLEPFTKHIFALKLRNIYQQQKVKKV